MMFWLLIAFPALVMVCILALVVAGEQAHRRYRRYRR